MMRPLESIRQFFHVIGPIAMMGQAIGYLGAHAVVALKISNGLNPLKTPLAAAASMATFQVVNATLYNICVKIGFSVNFASIISGTFSVVAGAGIYASTSVLLTDDLVAINLIILCIAVSTKLIKEICTFPDLGRLDLKNL